MLGVVGGFLRARQRLLETSGTANGVEPIELLREPFGAGAIHGCFGQRDGCSESLRVGAGVQRRKRCRRIDGSIDDLRGDLARPQLGRRAQGRAASIQTAHPQLEACRRLAPVHVRRLAHLGTHAGPPLGVGVE